MVKIETLQVKSSAGNTWTLVLVNGKVDSSYRDAMQAHARIHSLKANIKPNREG